MNLIPHKDTPFSAKQVANFIDKLVETSSGCIEWTGCLCGEYGRVGLNGKSWPTHRASYAMFNGPIPEGLVVRHKCDNPPCCNPQHLEIGTKKDNAQDMVKRGRCNPPRGERSAIHKLTRKIVSQIKTHLLNGTMNQLELATLYGVCHNTIHSIRMGISWANIPPLLPQEIPQPFRKYSDQDYLDMRQKWRDGWTLKQLSEEYECRIDFIQAVIRGKRGKKVSVGLRVIRQNKNKLDDATRQEMLRRHKAGESQITLAKEFGMSKNGISLMFQKMQEAA